MTAVPAAVPAKSVFLAGPFKALVDSDGAMAAAERARFESLIDRLEADGYQVHNAHRRESWGAKFLTPQECTRLDFDEISACTVFVAFPGHPASPGTHIEIGWASALDKPIVLLLEDEREYAFLVRGLHTVANVSYLTMRDGEDLAERVSAVVKDMAAVGSAAPVGV